MKRCKDKKIKALLPDYREQGLTHQDELRVQHHLDSCADCRKELSLLIMMSDDTVPDPGEAFWSALPSRVFYGVQREAVGRRFDLAHLWNLLTRHRLAAVATTIGLALLISLITIRMPNRELLPSVSRGDVVISEPIDGDSTEIVRMNELNDEEFEKIGAWAGTQFASLSIEAGQDAANSIFDMDLNDELSDLNAQDVERLSSIIDQLEQEG